jgi:hypothetical protein
MSVGMRHAGQFLIRFAPVTSVLALTLIALAFFHHYWGDAARAQAVGALFAFLTAVILVGITWEYVRINQKTLALQEAQWDQQNMVVLRFGVRRHGGRAQVWVANLGRSDFLVSELRVRIKDREPIVVRERRMVRAGSRPVLPLPEALWMERTLISLFDLQLRYESQHDSGLSPARAFTLVVANSNVIKVIRGIDGSSTWWVSCPSCKELSAMVVDGLEDFDEAQTRQGVMESELRATCPAHQSQWMESVQRLRDRRAGRDRDANKED